MVRKIADQKENESRRLWKEVTAGLRLNDIDKATNSKTTLEQKQREEAKQRKEQTSEWETKVGYFNSLLGVLLQLICFFNFSFLAIRTANGFSNILYLKD